MYKMLLAGIASIFFFLPASLQAKEMTAQDIDYKELARILHQTPEFKEEWAKLEAVRRAGEQEKEKDWLEQEAMRGILDKTPVMTDKNGKTVIYLSFNCNYCDSFWERFMKNRSSFPGKISVRLLMRNEAETRVAYVFRRLTERDPKLGEAFLTAVFADKRNALGERVNAFMDKWLRATLKVDLPTFMAGMENREREELLQWQKDFGKLPEQYVPMIVVNGKILKTEDWEKKGQN